MHVLWRSTSSTYPWECTIRCSQLSHVWFQLPPTLVSCVVTVDLIKGSSYCIGTIWIYITARSWYVYNMSQAYQNSTPQDSTPQEKTTQAEIEHISWMCLRWFWLSTMVITIQPSLGEYVFFVPSISSNSKMPIFHDCMFPLWTFPFFCSHPQSQWGFGYWSFSLFDASPRSSCSCLDMPKRLCWWVGGKFQRWTLKNPRKMKRKWTGKENLVLCWGDV